MDSEEDASEDGQRWTPPPRKTSLSKKSSSKTPDGKQQSEGKEAEASEDGQQGTSPSHRITVRKKSKSDTPDPRQSRTTKSRSSSPEDEAARPSSRRSRVSFEEGIEEDSSDSDAFDVLPSTQPRQYIRAPKFNGTTAFEIETGLL